mgnify:CR=1 FL=1
MTKTKKVDNAMEIRTQKRGYKFTDINGNVKIYTKLKEGCVAHFGGYYHTAYSALRNNQSYYRDGFKVEAVNLEEIYKVA